MSGGNNLELISKVEETQLREYISRYCINKEHVEIILNELVGGGHKSARDPFVKYIVPILATRILLEESVEQLQEINRNLKFLSLRKIENEQAKILQRLESLEKLTFQENIKNSQEGKTDRILSIIVATFVGIITGIMIFNFWLNFKMLTEKSVKNQPQGQSFQEHHRTVHKTFHRPDS